MRISLLEAASQFSDTANEFIDDMEAGLDKEPDFAGVTEVGDRHKQLVALSRKLNYTLVHPTFPKELYPVVGGKHVSTALLIRGAHQVVRSGFIPVVPGQAGPAAQGGHDPRGFTWAEAIIKSGRGYERVWVGQFHFITHGHLVGPADPERRAKNIKLIRTGAEVVKKEASGTDLGFLMGDANIEDKMLEIPGMTSIFQDLEPSEQGGIITILSYDRDARVSAKRLIRLPMGHSDHRFFEAVYEIAERKPA